MPHLFFVIVILVIKSMNSQSIEKDYRPSNVELIPNFVILNSTSTTNFLCINHQSDQLPLMISLSKNISTNQIKLFRQRLNQTTTRIRLQLRDYLGIFHLYCYSKGNKNKGTLADIIGKSEPGPVVLAKRCQVHERKYIKCTFRAPNIARAIQNDFPEEFEFRELTNLAAYSSKHEFWKNESTNEDLVFSWIPSRASQFPDNVFLNMTIQLPYFRRLSYSFDMTPVFVVKPNFQLKNLGKNQIQIELAPIFPLAMCTKRLKPKLNSNITHQWTKLYSTRNITIIDNLLSDTIYEICICCRERSDDRYEIIECQEIRTPRGSIYTITAIATTSGIILLGLIIGLIYYFNHHRQLPKSDSTDGTKPEQKDLLDENKSTESPVDNLPSPRTYTYLYGPDRSESQ